MAYGLANVDGFSWQNPAPIGAITYVCGFCGDKVSSYLGYFAHHASGTLAKIRICPSCNLPTFFDYNNVVFPQPLPGINVSNVPVEINNMYNEARSCVSVGAFTGSVLLSRKLLMNIGVQEGAEEGKAFVYYIEYLSAKGFIPPNGKTWVDYIRTKGNEATHEIQVMSIEDATILITFTEMLLRFIYQFPNLIPTVNP